MKAKTLRTLTVIGMLTVAGSWVAWAGTSHVQTSTDEDETSTESTGMMDGHGMMRRQGMNRHSMTQGMMERWGVTPEMQARGHMMMGATLSRDDPGAILGLRDELGLTDAQVSQLEALRSATVDKAQGLLTEDQRTQLKQIPEKSGSMAEMYRRMQGHMQQMNGSETVDQSTTSTPCPMMQMMMGHMMNGSDSHSGHHG